ncbi:hypothetical protein DIPPA_19465 [Diplonema papillatum]|nr:hypothetical protein DIPPA_19465 [Diplonema papillatum]
MVRLSCLLVAAVAVLAMEKKGTDQHLWGDTEMTTQLWRLCSQGKVSELKALLEDQPDAATMRSSDGRGPLWWAREHKRNDVFDLLVASGADPNAEDIDGRKPTAMNEPGLAEYVKAEREAKRQQMEDLDITDEDESEDYTD